MLQLRITLFAILPAILSAGTAEGTITINGKVTRLAYAYAIVEPDTFHAAKFGVRLIVTDSALSDDQVADESDLNRLVRSGTVHGIQMSFDSDKECYSARLLTHDTKSSVSGLWHSPMFVPNVFDEKTIDGDANLGILQEIADAKFQYSFKVHTDIRPLKPVAVPTSADAKAALTSPQAKAYLAYQRVLESGDVPAIKNAVTSETRKMMSSEPDFPKMLELVRAMMAKQIRILKVTVNGNSAELMAEGKDDSGDSAGVIKMAFEDGQWKVGRESWQTKPKAEPK